MFIPPDVSVLRPELVARARRTHLSLAIHLVTYELLGRKEVVTQVQPLREVQFRLLPDRCTLTLQQTNRILSIAAQVNVQELMHIQMHSLYCPLMHIQQEKAEAVIDLLLPSCFYQLDVLSRSEFKEILMKEHDFSRVPQDVYKKLDSALASLEAALLEKDPMMKHHLRESHSLLVTYPETVVLLKPNEVNTLIRAAEQHTGTEIVKAIATSKGGGGKRKAASLDDI